MTTRLANEIQQSSLTMFHPAYVSPVCRDVWEAQVWFQPSDSPLEGGVGGGREEVKIKKHKENVRQTDTVCLGHGKKKKSNV